MKIIRYADGMERIKCKNCGSPSNTKKCWYCETKQTFPIKEKGQW